MFVVGCSHAFHYIVEDGITYLCLADEQLKRRIPFAFLQDVKERFKATYSSEQAHAAIAFAMNDDFARVLQKQMQYYSENPDADSIGRVRSQIDDIKETMVENIEKLLQRGEKIDLLVDKTDRMQQAAFTFEKSATSLKDALWWKNVKMYFIIGLIVSFVVFFIAATACGGLKFKDC
mmetsp:Transcript_7486/g.11795  ORF Transcript_7486/g.11795 Transcript_7486/m.11795 type:complete len:177 (+) Transcript_7486:267-797(+)